MSERASGILLPVFSLPGKYGIGCFSKEAYEFVDYLAGAHQKYWQILPLGPTSYGDSPYQSFSTYAGNPYFIDLEDLIAQGLLTVEECDAADFGDHDGYVNYGKLYESRFALLRKAYSRVDLSQVKAFADFLADNDEWIEDYALYMAVKGTFDDAGLEKWEDDIRLRKPEAMASYKEKLADEVTFWEYLQYEFYRQWMKLKEYANEKGIRIVGDIPIYVSGDSADVWANPDLFQLDEDGRPQAVAGCPPDAFAATGQLWGNPLYRWNHHKETGFAWWINRIRRCRKLYDVIRIDHFRGFDQYYSIPATDETAENGHWEDGPGMDLFDAIKAELGELPIIAEDLGFVTETVKQLVRDSGFPNMKVIEFAFDSRDTGSASDYLPHNYGTNAVVYTGTHDNNTLKGWLDEITPEEKAMVCKYVGVNVPPMEDNEIDLDSCDDTVATADPDQIIEGLIRVVMMSVADTCIIPIQDYLKLGVEARVNRPSTLGCNWQWRLSKDQLSEALQEQMRELTDIYGRQ